MNLDDAIRLAENCIFITGAPRSGTTWLAKIIDSHADVLYRHEPDEVLPEDPTLSALRQTAQWIAVRRARVATKRPTFRKRWAGIWSPLRSPIANFINFYDDYIAKSGWPRMPDFRAGRDPHTRAALKMVGWNGVPFVQEIANCRMLVIIRHPCGQVASTLNGMNGERFRSSLPDTQRRMAMGCATRNGLKFTDFVALSDAAKLAWVWRSYYEEVLRAAETNDRIHVVVYEDLCERTLELSQEIFRFVDLAWSDQTARFVNKSTAGRPDGYYGVMRESQTVANQWRTTMSAADQEAVLAVTANCAPAQYYPDLNADKRIKTSE